MHGAGLLPAAARVAARGCPARGRSVGLLVVKVVEAEGLKKMDTFGKSDPFVEMYTQAQQMEKTARALDPIPSPQPFRLLAGAAVRGMRRRRWTRAAPPSLKKDPKPIAFCAGLPGLLL